jgi:transcriptional regulator with XRE-family HTH domain
MAMTLKEHRHLRHISVRDLASMADISQTTIRRIERRGYKRIDPRTIQQISNALNVAPQQVDQFAPFSLAPR